MATDPFPLGLTQDIESDSHVTGLRQLEDDPVTAAVDLFAAREHVSPNVAARVRLEFLRFFSLVFLAGAETITPSMMVKRFWIGFASLGEEYTSFVNRHNFQHFAALKTVPQDNLLPPSTAVAKTEQLMAKFFPNYDARLWRMTTAD